MTTQNKNKMTKKIQGPEFYIIENSGGCRIEGLVTRDELDKFLAKGWKIVSNKPDKFLQSSFSFSSLLEYFEGV